MLGKLTWALTGKICFFMMAPKVSPIFFLIWKNTYIRIRYSFLYNFSIFKNLKALTYRVVKRFWMRRIKRSYKNKFVIKLFRWVCTVHRDWICTCNKLWIRIYILWCMCFDIYCSHGFQYASIYGARTCGTGRLIPRFALTENPSYYNRRKNAGTATSVGE